MTMLTRRLAAVAAGSFGQSGLEIGGLPTASACSSINPALRSTDSSTTFWIWTFIGASVGFVVLAVLVFWAMGGLGELGLSGTGVVALTLGFLFTGNSQLALWRSSLSGTTAVATTRPIGRPSTERDGALSPWPKTSLGRGRRP
jgi:hypothetical protein